MSCVKVPTEQSLLSININFNLSLISLIVLGFKGVSTSAQSVSISSLAPDFWLKNNRVYINGTYMVELFYSRIEKSYSLY